MVQENILQNGKIVEWKIDSGPKNTFTESVLQDIIQKAKVLKERIHKNEDKESLRLLILTASPGKYFSNGLDPDLFLDKDRETVEKAVKLLMEASHLYFTLPIPTLVKIEGHCMGAGAVFAILSDYRFMKEGAGRIGFPESAIHLNFPSFPARVLADLVGRNKARDLLFTGKLLKPRDALQIGLIDGLFSDSEEKAVHETIESILKLSLNSAQGMKVALNNYYQLDYEKLAWEDVKNLVHTITSPEGQESFRRLKQAI